MPGLPCIVAVGSPPADFASLAAELSGLGVCTRWAEAENAVEPNASVIVCDADNVADWAKTLRHFQKSRPNCPVVFLTRLADEHLWLQMLEAGAYDLLEKPYRTQDLRWVVTSALKRRLSAGAA